MAYTIRKIQRKSGIVFSAIIKNQLGEHLKSNPKLAVYYAKHTGHDPVKPDDWLVAAGIPRGRKGRESNAEKEFNELFLKS